MQKKIKQAEARGYRRAIRDLIWFGAWVGMMVGYIKFAELAIEKIFS